jgi:Leucine-rich repeat (LRR) protein
MRWTCACVVVATLSYSIGRADDAEDTVAKWVESVDGKLTRNDKAVGKPVIGVEFLPLNKKVTNDGLKELKGFKNLQRLSIFFCEQIGDDGMKHVKELTGLEQLVLGNTSVTDAGLAELKGLKKLQSLTVSGCIRMTDKCTETIKGFTDLEYLSLPSTVTEKGVKNLIGLKKLTGLYIGGAKLTDAAVKDIANNMSNLVTLDLGAFAGTDITDASVPNLARLTKLKKLGLQGSRITDSGLKILREKLPDCTITAK